MQIMIMTLNIIVVVIMERLNTWIIKKLIQNLKNQEQKKKRKEGGGGKEKFLGLTKNKIQVKVQINIWTLNILMMKKKRTKEKIIIGIIKMLLIIIRRVRLYFGIKKKK